MPAMQHLLAQHPTLDTVMALNDPAALGALAALATAGRTDVSVYGVDGVPESKELILSGRMTATAGQSPRSIGRAAAQTAYALLAGSSYEAHQVLPITLFTQENLSAAQAKEWD
jgi:ribose transport system substrate-binding protein